jgi:hypothetical protein
MKPLLWLSVGLDLLGVLAGALLAAQLRHHNLGLVLQADGVAFGLVFLLLAWFLGCYSFLRWPWMPYLQLAQRWFLVVFSALGLAVLAGWLLNVAATAVWFHRSTLLILGAALAPSAGASAGQPTARGFPGGRGQPSRWSAGFPQASACRA